MKLHIVFAGALSVALLATPAAARHHYRHHARTCVRMHHGHCTAYAAVRTRHAYRVGYVFGPTYGYTAYSALPQPYVVRYHLSPDYRYVYSGNTIYVVDPATYAITRILNAMPR